MNVYELSIEYAERIADLENCETEEEQDAILAVIDSLDEDIEQKAEAYARIIRNYRASVDTYASEIKRLQSAKSAAEKAVERMTDYLHYAMEIAGKTAVQTTIGKFSRQLNPPSVDVLDEKAIPETYFIPQPAKLDKKSLLADLKMGKEIPGANMVRKEGLRFR